MPVIHYIVLEDVKALVPAEWLTEALDDDADNTASAFDVVLAAAEMAVNGVLSMQYRVPITNPDDSPFLKHVTSLEFARLCYARRGYKEEGFPHQSAWEAAWDQLKEIGKGELQLNPAAGTNQELAKPRGAVISGRSKVVSSDGSLTA